MSSKQQRAVKGNEHKVSRNESWSVLNWDDLTEWAGSRSVDRGRAYQKQRRVHELAISDDGRFLATVTGGVHPERSLAIYRQRVDDHLPHASASAYEAVAGYLRKMRPIFQGLRQDSEWDGLLADIRLRYKNRPKFMEILDRLAPKPIVEQKRIRR